jgi:hypothetical protein
MLKRRYYYPPQQEYTLDPFYPQTAIDKPIPAMRSHKSLFNLVFTISISLCLPVCLSVCVYVCVCGCGGGGVCVYVRVSEIECVEVTCVTGGFVFVSL